MSHAGHYNPFRNTIASEFVGKPWLQKDVEHNAVLINGSPEVMSTAVDLEENLIKNLSHQHRIVS